MQQPGDFLQCRAELFSLRREMRQIAAGGKHDPSPVNITARISSRSSQAMAASKRSRQIAGLNAFAASGRFNASRYASATSNAKFSKDGFRIPLVPFYNCHAPSPAIVSV